MTQEELDELFRANAARADYAPRPDDWAAMSGMLDAADRRDRIARLVSAVWLAVFAGLIAVGVAGTWYYAAQPDAAATDVRADDVDPVVALATDADGDEWVATGDSQADLSRVEDQASSASGAPAAAPPREPRVQPIAPGVRELASATTRPRAPTQRTAGEAAIRPAQGTSDRENVSQVGPSGAAHRTSQGTGSPTASRSAPTTDAASSPAPNDMGLPTQQLPAGATDAQAPAQPKAVLAEANPRVTPFPTTTATPLPSRASAFVTPTPHTLDIAGAAPPPPPRPAAESLRRRLAWGLRAVASTELSSVALSADTRRNLRAGLLADFPLLERWSLTAGATYGTKDYFAWGKDYAPDEDFFVGGVAATQIEATCASFELPVLASYLSRGYRQTGWFASAGVTSSVLLREEFAYDYAHAVPGQMMDKRVDDADVRLAGTLEAHVGVRLVHRGRYALRVGPYAQVPLGDMGTGNVALYTGGVQLGLEWLR